MSKIVVQTFLTLDGVVQAPGTPEEDRDGGFPHGGWQVPHMNEESGEIVGRWMDRAEGVLLGRKTYAIFAAHWPHVGDDNEDADVARQLNSQPKYVASRTLDHVDWQNSTLLGDDVPGAVAKLRGEPGGEIQVWGSSDLVRTLIRHDLVDEFRLLIYPIVLGTGKRLFGDGTAPTAFELVETRGTAAGVIVAVYRRAGELSYGSKALED